MDKGEAFEFREGIEKLAIGHRSYQRAGPPLKAKPERGGRSEEPPLTNTQQIHLQRENEKQPRN